MPFRTPLPEPEINIMPTRLCRPIILSLWLGAAPGAAGAIDPAAVWDSRCDQCHGDASEFAGKYLWEIGGHLQGRHHVADLRIFLGNHYAPDHLIDLLEEMLAKYANTATRFAEECGTCHGDAEAFARDSIEFRWRKVRGVKSGEALEDFLPSHRDLSAADADFFASLLARFVEQQE
jgi:hypothetical protein